MNTVDIGIVCEYFDSRRDGMKMAYKTKAGVELLSYLGAAHTTKIAYSINPIFIYDAELANFGHRFAESTNKPLALMYVMDFRSFVVQNTKHISCFAEVNKMLIAYFAVEVAEIVNKYEDPTKMETTATVYDILKKLRTRLLLLNVSEEQQAELVRIARTELKQMEASSF